MEWTVAPATGVAVANGWSTQAYAGVWGSRILWITHNTRYIMNFNTYFDSLTYTTSQDFFTRQQHEEKAYDEEFYSFCQLVWQDREMEEMKADYDDCFDYEDDYGYEEALAEQRAIYEEYRSEYADEESYAYYNDSDGMY